MFFVKLEIMQKIIYGVCFILLVYGLSAQVAKPAQGTFALTNATIETVTNGQVKGNLIVQDGKIAAIGADAAIPSGATVIDCQDHFIYPGMIDGGTQLGLEEVSSVSLTRDYNEIGEIIPQMQALTAVNPNAVAIPVTRVNGVTTVIAAPRGSVMPGTASLINLIGYTPDQMFAGFKGVILNYPSSARRGRWDRRSEEDRKKAEEKRMKKVNEAWKAAELYATIVDAAKDDPTIEVTYSPESEALYPVVKGDYPLMIEVNRAADIQAAIKWVKDKEIKVVFTGVAEGWRVADEIAAAGIPVIAGPMLSLPTRVSDRYDRPYANPGIMQKAGVKVAIRSGDSENVRNLPFNAGFAAAYGMGKEEALKAVTIVPAEIFGVAERIGSLEVGKDANLFISDGDPFETKTQIKHLFINGWQVAMDNRQIQLYNEFLDRSPGLKNK